MTDLESKLEKFAFRTLIPVIPILLEIAKAAPAVIAMWRDIGRMYRDGTLTEADLMALEGTIDGLEDEILNG